MMLISRCQFDSCPCYTKKEKKEKARRRKQERPDIAREGKRTTRRKVATTKLQSTGPTDRPQPDRNCSTPLHVGVCVRSVFGQCVGVIRRKLQTPGNAEEHKRQETPTCVGVAAVMPASLGGDGLQVVGTAESVCMHCSTAWFHPFILLQMCHYRCVSSQQQIVNCKWIYTEFMHAIFHVLTCSAHSLKTGSVPTDVVLGT